MGYSGLDVLYSPATLVDNQFELCTGGVVLVVCCFCCGKLLDCIFDGYWTNHGRITDHLAKYVPLG